MKIFPLILILLTITGCSTGSKNECESPLTSLWQSKDECFTQQAFDKVIAIHDEAMPRLARISELKEQIERRINFSADSLTASSWQQLLMDLDEADEAMWAWMHQFDADLEDVPVKEALAYLQEEEVKIDSVAIKIREAIGKAEERLK